MPASGPAIASSALDAARQQGRSAVRAEFLPSMCCRLMSCASIPEDRKFFLNGALYCALAAAIGAGKSFRQLVRELEKDFPSDQIHEALKRLSRPPLRGPGTALVRGPRRRLLGEPRPAAGGREEKSPETVACAFKSIDVQGATELGAALKALGVRVVKGAADLTVTLVSDYLEARLAELNRQHLSDRTRWLLVQPSGIFPLVGPVFSPGRPEQERLLDLSRRADANATARSRRFLDRKQARRVAASPLARGPVRTERHPACGRRDRESDRHRLSHRLARSSSSASTCWARPS